MMGGSMPPVTTEMEVEEMKVSLSKMNTNQLREMAVSLGADRKKLYGTSKQALMLTVQKLQKEAK